MYTVVKMCKWLEVSRSGYYEWRRLPQSATAPRQEILKELISELSDETDDDRRIHAGLLQSGHACSPELVRALQRQMGLVPNQPRPWWLNPTDQDPAAGWIPDVLDRDNGAGEQSPQDSVAPTARRRWPAWRIPSRREIRVALTDVLLCAQQTALCCVVCMVLVAVAPALWGWTTTVVISGSMGPRIHRGDIVAAAPRSPHATKRLAAGAVVLVKNPAHPDELLLHRLVEYTSQGQMILKGDANAVQDSTPVPVDNLHGVARLRIPFVGLPYLWIQEGQYVPAVSAVILLLALVPWPPRKRRKVAIPVRNLASIDAPPDESPEADAESPVNDYEQAPPTSRR